MRARDAFQLLAFLLTTVFVAIPARAQYYIGDFYYTCPVGVAWSDPRCVREPVAQPNSAPPSSAPSTAWTERWGSVFIDPGSVSLGATTLGRTEAEAELIAHERCAADGSKNCRWQATFRNSCVAVALPSKEGWIGVTTGLDRSALDSAALEQCGGSARGCYVAYSECTPY